MPTNIVYGTVLTLKLLLPYFDHVAGSASLDPAPGFSEARVAKIFSTTNNPSVSVFLDNGRYRFHWRAFETNHYMGRLSQYTDWKESLASRDPVTDLEPLTRIRVTLTEREALAIAQRFLRLLGYSEEGLGVSPPEIRQMEFLNADTGRVSKLPFFAVRYLPRFAPSGIDDNLRTGIKMEISGVTKSVVHYVLGYVRNEQVDLRRYAKPLELHMPPANETVPKSEKPKQ